MNTVLRISGFLVKRNIPGLLREVHGSFKIHKHVLQHNFNSRVISRTYCNMASVKLEVLPKSGLVDSDLDIVVNGLKPFDLVTLYADVTNDGVTFGAVGHYVSDRYGNISTRKDTSVGGNYVGVEPEGLLWSLVPVPGQTVRSNHRLLKQDISDPYSYRLSLFEDHLTLEDVAKAKPTASSTFERSYKAPNVSQIPVRHGRVRGSLLIPDGPGPYLPVIDMFGMVGKLLEFRSGLLASHGFAALALPYFGHDDLPPRLRKVDMGYFEEAIDFLIQDPRIDCRRGVGVIGVSKGAEIALLMAEYFKKVGAVVCINGGAFVTEQPVVYKGVERAPIDFSKLDIKFRVAEDGAIGYREAFNSVDIALDFWEDYGIKIEKSDAKFLFLAGNLDEATHPMCTVLAAERLRQANKEENCEVHIYDGAGHLLEPPHAPLGTRGYNKNLNLYFAYGGNPVMHARAQEDSWRHILSFLKRSLSSPSKL